MTHNEFRTLMNATFDRLFELAKDADCEEDVLQRFKSGAAECLRLTPEQVWSFYADTRWTSIMAYCRAGRLRNESIDDCIDDALLCLLLLRGLMAESRIASCSTDPRIGGEVAPAGRNPH